MKRELFIGSLLVIKLCVYLIRAQYPMRNPLYVLQLSDARKPITTVYRIFYMFLSVGFVVICFILRTLSVIYRKHAEDFKKIEKMGGEFFTETFNNLSDSDEENEGKFGGDQLKGRLINSKSKQNRLNGAERDNYQSFEEDHSTHLQGSGIDFRKQQENKIENDQESYGSGKRKSKTQNFSSSYKVDNFEDEIGERHPGYEQSDSEDEYGRSTIYTID